MITIADTETTGFKKSGPLMQEGQARVIQLAISVLGSLAAWAMIESKSVVVAVREDDFGSLMAISVFSVISFSLALL